MGGNGSANNIDSQRRATAVAQGHTAHRPCQSPDIVPRDANGRPVLLGDLLANNPMNDFQEE